MKGNIENFYLGEDKKYHLLLSLDGDFRQDYEKLREKDVDIEITKWSPKKTDAENRFMWVLCNKIAKRMKLTPQEVYRKSVKEVPGVAKWLCIQSKDVESFIATWESLGIGWQVDVFDSQIQGCNVVVYYRGSSTYTTKEMSDLIGNLIYDAEELGINTDTPEKEAYWDHLLSEGYKGRVYNGRYGYKEFR